MFNGNAYASANEELFQAWKLRLATHRWRHRGQSIEEILIHAVRETGLVCRREWLPTTVMFAEVDVIVVDGDVNECRNLVESPSACRRTGWVLVLLQPRAVIPVQPTPNVG
ncbi:hypothetical protein A6V36_30470 [Paraburkholderia ginsengiterrae]|uniref:Uncharacterized protein n=1 Tax=Paraburkholderia ginsengiterrae TaxID=1462993 RepID=A0A1A9N317_9BURK|nr:hypothetical protein A6V37_32150 [Paraburkholderia ginsengiterrae]OAJ58569.1 hypothetical protein A6V36_30470 [Paraburkholderia ginsengiterrae]